MSCFLASIQRLPQWPMATNLCNKAQSVIIVMLMLLGSSSCTPGFIYTDITEPFDTNMNNTEIVSAYKGGESFELKDPISAVGVRVQVEDRTVGGIAARNKLNVITASDMRLQSWLGGLWVKRTLILYGEQKGSQ
jgi:hypothetical protein